MWQIRLGAGIGALAMVGLYGLLGLSSIEPGEVGVVVKNFGENRGMQETTFDTGIHWVEPFMYDVVVYDTRLKQYNLDNTPANTKDGQPIEVDVSFELGLLDAGVPQLHENIGRAYYDQVVYPAARSALRTSTAKLLSDEIYTGAGRAEVQQAVANVLIGKLEPLGIRITPNLKDITFLNNDFVQTLERKAKAAQEQVIQQRLAEAAAQEAIKVKNQAEGQKFKSIQEAEAQREKLRLEGEGFRLQKEEEAKGILAIATAEAEGIRLKNVALAGAGGDRQVSIAWAENLGPNVKVYGVPTGAPGTNTFIFDKALKDALGAMGR
jgi:regulator of protease activity HflC (stomatin/prohibitin superfamily)